MNHISAHLPLLILAAATAFSHAQSFPIVPMSEPIYPENEPEFDNFDVYNNLGTMQRVGDINNDGRDDLVVVFINDSSFGDLLDQNGCWIYLRNEDGTFAKPYPLEATLTNEWDFVYDFTIHDHNHDGFTDIIFTSIYDALPLFGSPDGFTQGGRFFHHLYQPEVLYTDTNGDGRDDLVFWSKDNFNIDIRLNVGDVGYIHMPVPEYNINSEYAPADIRFSDFDGDGDIDILITNGFELYWLEKINGFYREPVLWTFNLTNFFKDDIAVFADVNADGLTDVVLDGYTPDGDDAYGFYLAPFINGEDREVPYFVFPEFENQRSRNFTNPDEWTHTLHSPGDLDGDGTDDLILKPYEDSNIAWRITDPLNHNGRFGISNEIDIHGDGMTEADQYPDFEYNTADAYLDVNNDGVLDRIIPASARTEYDPKGPGFAPEGIMLWAVLGNPFMPGTVFNEQDTIRTTNSNVHFTHADIDYDGEPEVILTRQDDIRTVRRDLDDNWSYDRYPGNTRFRDSNSGFRSIVTQLDSDSRLELVSQKLQNSNNPLPAIFLNVEVPAYGEFYHPESYGQNINFDQLLEDHEIDFAPNSSSFAVGDLDADGDNDIIIRGRGNYYNEPTTEVILSWLNDGEANFTPGPLSIINSYGISNIHMVELLDHNNDGYPDLVNIESGTSDGPTLAIYENDGLGNFTPSLQIPLANPTNGNYLWQYWIEVNDLDLDGYDDIQVLNKNTSDQSEVVVLYGSATGISTEPVFFSGAGAAEVHCADLDGNGLPDLYTCSYESRRYLKNSISIMFQTAPRVFLPAISINDIDMSAVDALDMNRDGAIDLIGGGTDTDDLRVIYSVPKPCPADLNLDKILDFFDITLFIQMYTNQRPLADLNHDGIIDFFDFSTLLDTFRNGCP